MSAVLKNGPDSDASLSRQPARPKPAELQFERPDWTLFRSPVTLAQKAGVSIAQLRRLVLKELADNALDAGATVEVTPLAGGDTYVVHDDGPGITGGAERIGRLFSLNRPLLSSKLIRLPTRGAMGNGLRVVTGAAFASGGRLQVTTLGKVYVLTPKEDGSTHVEEHEDAESVPGTAVFVVFGPGLPSEPDTMKWARRAVELSAGGSTYAGKTSPRWYDATSFFEALKAARWPERHACALLTGKGFGSRAIRDLIDGFADDDESVTVFCIHDADASGSLIYEALQEETRARGRRRLEIVNLGLEPWEAVGLGLAVESISYDKAMPVAAYVRERDDHDWSAWLQEHRVELNEFTTPAFIAWLDGKLEGHAGKLIPPEDVVGEHLRDEVRSRVREAVVARILRDARADEQVEAAFAAIERPADNDLVELIEDELSTTPTDRWTVPLAALADELAEAAR